MDLFARVNLGMWCHVCNHIDMPIELSRNKVLTLKYIQYYTCMITQLMRRRVFIYLSAAS